MEGLTADRHLLARTSTADRVADVLRTHIAEGTLAPGTRLSEASIATILGISRNTLREAFRLLIQERLLTYEMNRGVAVRELTVRDVTDAYKARLALEAAGLRNAAAAEPRLLAAVHEAVAQGERAAAREEWSAVATADLNFHRALARLAGSDRIDEFMRRLLAELRPAFHVMPSPREFHGPYLRRNRVIADLLAAGDLPAAERELTDYLDNAEAQITDRMREVRDAGGPR
ncbi:GntR family transcriptional regulator [Actinomadura alba]|uniref:GntR family transcriptional regulator n=1 Tax=Actinomadura alba TaxID=406431 RepID=UPI0028A93AD9|nr:GntR family transcriptional regulator [Actinomadura alba]